MICLSSKVSPSIASPTQHPSRSFSFSSSDNFTSQFRRGDGTIPPIAMVLLPPRTRRLHVRVPFRPSTTLREPRLGESSLREGSRGNVRWEDLDHGSLIGRVLPFEREDRREVEILLTGSERNEKDGGRMDDRKRTSKRTTVASQLGWKAIQMWRSQTRRRSPRCVESPRSEGCVWCRERKTRLTCENLAECRAR